eukprot:TRINITY_DN1641_c0_g1_i4.p1 TRINITY_DN1641_c0_g1~~TRINITY_DN1641_c0_g1_i4.p1  ORF type:complete len:298 (-),score=58.41 TRINITY_DN1641_c0_g1_i4:103-996(-)
MISVLGCRYVPNYKRETFVLGGVNLLLYFVLLLFCVLGHTNQQICWGMDTHSADNYVRSSGACILFTTTALVAYAAGWGSLAYGVLNANKKWCVVFQALQWVCITSFVGLFLSSLVDLVWLEGYFEAAQAVSSCQRNASSTVWEMTVVLSVLLTAFNLACSFFMGKFSAQLSGPSLIDYARWASQVSFNWLKCGREGISYTAGYLGARYRQSAEPTLLVKLQSDSFFHELPFTRPHSESLEALLVATAQLLRCNPNDISRLLKNSEVLVDSDADVARLKSGDRLDVILAHDRADITS